MTQLDLDWADTPQRIDSGTVEGVLAYCGCGWRSHVSAYGRKANQEEADRRVAFHRERTCPWRQQ